jgi:hypothetical protein
MPREEVSFARGTKATMPQAKVPGRLLIATDTGEAYVDDTATSRVQLKDTTKVSKSGDTMSGPLNMGSNKITNVATPTADSDAANLGSVKSETAKVKYTGGTAITVDDSEKTISHKNIGIAGSVGPSANATPAPGGTFNVPQITTDAQGHVSSKTNRTVTIPQYSAGMGLSISGTAISHANNGTAGSYGPTGNVTPGYGGTFEIPQITTNAQGHVTAITMRTVRLPSAQDIPEVETYTGVSPITVSGTQISHNNIGTAGSVGPTGNSTATHGGTITIPYITVDAKGHVSAKSNRTITLPAGPVNMKGASSSAAGSAGYVPAPAAGAANRYLRSDGTWAMPPDTNTTYTATGGITLTGTQFKHSNSVTAGNKGPTANSTVSPGSTFNVPQIYYDAYGHVTSSATNRTMTLNSSILDTSDILTSLSGVSSNTKVLGAKLVADAINNLKSEVSTLNTNLGIEVIDTTSITLNSWYEVSVFTMVKCLGQVFVYLDCHCTLPNSSWAPDIIYQFTLNDATEVLPASVTPNTNSRTVPGIWCNNNWSSVCPIILNFTHEGTIDIVVSKVVTGKWIKVCGMYTID